MLLIQIIEYVSCMKLRIDQFLKNFHHRWCVDCRVGLQHFHRIDFAGLHLEGGLGEEEDLNGG